MTATIEIPDPLYQKVAAKSARRGQNLGEATVALYVQWLADEEPEKPEPTPEVKERLARLEAWFREADDVMSKAPPGPSAREMLIEDRRNRTP
jgi:hypothetical protein